MGSGLCGSNSEDTQSSQSLANSSRNGTQASQKMTAVTNETDDEKKTGDIRDPLKSTSDLKMPQLIEIMREGIVKTDHFENIYRLEPKLNGCPNIRRVSGYLIFGTGQPTKKGAQSFLDVLSSMYHVNKSNVTWFNMRSEPVIYVNDGSYAPRSSDRLCENIHFGNNLSVPDIQKLQNEMLLTVQKNTETAKKSGDGSFTFTYHKDTYALLPQDRKDMVLTEGVTDIQTDILALPSLFKSIGIDNFHRLPVNDERAPDAQDIDKLVSIVLKSAKEDAIVFNCQMGKGRTTEGMICACLIKNQMGHSLSSSSIDERGASFPVDIPSISTEESRDILKKYDYNAKEEAKSGNPEIKRMRSGNFKIIRSLMNAIKDECGPECDERIKNEVDDIIDRCQHLQNMRSCIFICKVIRDKETKSDRKMYWLHLARNFIERYAVLILFNAYLHDSGIIGSRESSKAYSKWVGEDHPGLMDLVKGALSTFEWE